MTRRWRASERVFGKRAWAQAYTILRVFKRVVTVVRACMLVGLHHTEPAMVFVRLDDVIEPALFLSTVRMGAAACYGTTAG